VVVGLNAELAGKSYDSRTYEVTAAAIESYARATNDDNDVYLRGGDSVASPVFPIVAALGGFMEASVDPELRADLLRLVHGAEEHVLYKPIKPGDVLTVTPVLESVDQAETGETFTVKATLSDAHSEPIAEMRGTMFIRGSGSRRGGRVLGDEEKPDIVYEETTKVDDDQPRRYAEASGDRNPIHLDESTARSAGLRGVILHGMCTMAIATKAAVNGLARGDPARVKRVGVRFSRPVRPGDELTTRLWKETDGIDATTYGFETFNSKGAAVIKNGVVEVAH
jgi:acyl dehydratase